MEFPQIDLSQIEKPEISLFLCKPDRTIIAKLSEAYDINLNIKALQINELNFKLPLKIDYNNELINNPNIELIKYRYLIKVVLNNPGTSNNYIEYFLITTPISESGEQIDNKSFTCLSLINELAYRNISNYEVNSFTLEEIFNGGYDPVQKRYINGILTGTNWTIPETPSGIVSPILMNRARSINISSETNILNIILNTLVETYNIIPIFDTRTREIWIYASDDQIPFSKKIDDDILRLSYKKYLTSLNLKEDDSEFTTRLRTRGKDNLGIQAVTPTGQPFLEDFSYFLYGFNKEGETVTSHSPYWSDELCEAQIAYQEKLESYEGEFSDLLDNKLELEIERATLQIEAFNKLTDLFFTQDTIDVLRGINNGFYRIRQNIYTEPFQFDLNSNYYYYIMINISSLSGLTIEMNEEDITANLNEGSWYSEELLLINAGEASLEISITGHTDEEIKIDICRISEEEYDNIGTTEKRILFLGGVFSDQWRLGREEEESTIWGDWLQYNVSEEALAANLQGIYGIEHNIIVTRYGEAAKGTIYFEIEFPYSLAADSNLIGDFSLVENDATPFIITKQKRMLLLDKYNEDLKQTTYDQVMNEIMAVDLQIIDIDNAINVIKEDLALTNNFTTAEIEERNNFIIEKSYQNNFIINAQDLLYAATEYFKRVNEPALLLDLSLVNFMDIVEGYYDYDKLFYSPLMAGIYDTIIVHHEKHNINVACMILEIDYNFETGDINFIVSNVQDISDSQTKFLNDLKSSVSIASTVLQEKYKWDGAQLQVTELEDVLNRTWNAAERAINSGAENSVTIDNRGIRVIDPNNPLHVIAIVAGWLGISADGGNTYNTVLNADGIAAKYLIGQVIMGAQLKIINQGGNVEINETGIIVKDQYGDIKIQIGDLGDLNDPEYIIGSEYGFKFEGKTDPITGQEHYIQWDGEKLHIGGNLEAVTGSFIDGSIQLDHSGIKIFNQMHEKKIHIGDFGDLDDPLYIPGTDYGFEFIGDDENYLSWDGSTLHIKGELDGASGTFSGALDAASGTFSGSLDAVDGNFSSLVVGDENDYIELYQEAGLPYIKGVNNNLERIKIDSKSIYFYSDNPLELDWVSRIEIRTDIPNFDSRTDFRSKDSIGILSHSDKPAFTNYYNDQLSDFAAIIAQIPLGLDVYPLGFGTMTSSSNNTLTDSTKNWAINIFSTREAIVKVYNSDKTELLHTKNIISNTSDTITVDSDWSSSLPSGARYEILHHNYNIVVGFSDQNCPYIMMEPSIITIAGFQCDIQAVTRVDDTLFVSGNFYVQGSKNAMVEIENKENRAMYSIESPDSRFCDIIIANLTLGKNIITLPSLFKETISFYHIFTSVQGEGYITLGYQSMDEFELYLHNSDSCQVSCLIYGMRRNFEHEYMEKVDLFNEDIGKKERLI